MKIFLAWHNALEHPWQTAMAVSGVAFAIFLMFLQLGIRGAVQKNATLVFDPFDFDAVIVSPDYTFVARTGSVPRTRVLQAGGVSGVRAVLPVYMSIGSYRNPDSRLRCRVLVLGVDPKGEPFHDAALNARLELLQDDTSFFLDDQNLPICGPVRVGLITELEGRQMHAVGTYHMGSGFIGNGTLLVSSATYAKVLPVASPERVNIGLVRLEPGAPVGATIARLRQVLGPEVQVLPRDAFEEAERHYFMSVKPIGVMFTVGVVLSFIVGAVTLYQVMTSEVAKRSSEFATLKAIGYTDSYLNRLVFQQAGLMVSASFLPALVLAWGVYAIIRRFARVPAEMAGERIIFVILLTAMMCALAAGLTLRRLRKADPADLF